MTLTDLAERIGARVQTDGAASGDAGGVSVERCARIEDAGPDSVTFLSNPKYIPQLATTKAAAIIAGPDVRAAGKTLLVADDPYYAFRNAVMALHGLRRHPRHPTLEESQISDLAVVDPEAEIGAGTVVYPFAVICAGAKVGRGCVIYPHVFIGPDAVIGEDCQLYPSVTVYDRCVLGNRVTLHAGCVIGQDGFGYATHKGAHHKIPQAGNAVVEDDVEMGANCSIDRATLGSTRIGAGTKFSDGVTIGHGAEVGRHNLYVALVGLAGSVKTGDYVVMGGQVGVAGHLTIGKGAQIAASSGVMTDIPAGARWGGTPAVDLKEAMRTHLHTTKLPDLVARIKKLERELAELKKATGAATDK